MKRTKLNTNTSYSVELVDSLTRTCKLFMTQDVEGRLKRAGWDLGVAALETSSGSRVGVVKESFS